jgi:hypothetical protein
VTHVWQGGESAKVWAVRFAGGSLGLPESLGGGGLRGVVPEQQAEVDTWVVMEFCNRGTLQVGPSAMSGHTTCQMCVKAEDAL